MWSIRCSRLFSMVCPMQTHEARRDHLCQKVAQWPERLKVKPGVIRVQRMTRKWGSCSASGIITLSDDLIDEKAGFQDFVIAHELLHLRVPNHGKVFKALMSVYVPDWRKYECHGLQRFDNLSDRSR